MDKGKLMTSEEFRKFAVKQFDDFMREGKTTEKYTFEDWCRGLAQNDLMFVITDGTYDYDSF